MKVPDPGEERPLAWNAILADTPVYSSDGQEVGAVYEVLGAEDIFHGLVIRSAHTDEDTMIPAEQVRQITNRRVDVGLDAAAVRELPPYREEESFHLGIVGLFRRHVGWKTDEHFGGPHGGPD